MLPLLGGLISGGASLLGGLFSSNTSRDNTNANIAMQNQTNQMSVAENQKNRDFQQQMSNTAYQRASADMTEAGLNPMMMFGSGSAASSPSGGTPSLGTAKSENTSALGGMGDAVAKAVSSAVQYKTMDKMSDEMANLEAENYRIRAATENIHATTATEKERRNTEHERTDTQKLENVGRKLDRPRQEWDAIKYLDLSEINDRIRKTGNWGSWGGKAVSDAISPLANGASAVSRLLPRRSTSQQSGVDSKGNSFDKFWENRSGLSWR